MILSLQQRLENLDEDKCPRNDILQVSDVQKMIIQQFKHILMIFIEVLDLQKHKANSTKCLNDKRNEELTTQVSSLANWVMKFNPNDFFT